MDQKAMLKTAPKVAVSLDRVWVSDSRKTRRKPLTNPTAGNIGVQSAVLVDSGYEGDSDGEGWFVVYLICDCFASTEAAAIVGCVGGESFGISFDGRM